MNFLKSNLSFGVAVILTLTSCSNKTQIEQERTLLLGHRASGEGVKNGYIENTVPAVVEALKFGDGVEVDIQMSQDSTLWVYHDDLLNYNCDTTTIASGSCIPSLTDTIIGSIRICREGATDRIYRLSEVFELYSNYPEKYISLDVKGYFSQSCIATNNVDGNYLTAVARRISDLISSHNMVERVFVETDYTYLFERLKGINPSIKCHLLGYSDFDEKIERCMANNWNGVTFNMGDTSLNTVNVEALKAAGLELQLWTVRNEADLKRALQFKPTAVQVSNVNLLEKINQTRDIQTSY